MCLNFDVSKTKCKYLKTCHSANKWLFHACNREGRAGVVCTPKKIISTKFRKHDMFELDDTHAHMHNNIMQIACLNVKKITNISHFFHMVTIWYSETCESVCRGCAPISTACDVVCLCVLGVYLHMHRVSLVGSPQKISHSPSTM